MKFHSCSGYNNAVFVRYTCVSNWKNIFGTSTIAPLLDTIDLFVWSFTAST